MATVNRSLVDGLATIQLNRPAVLNAWNAELGDELLAALGAVADDEAVRAVVLTGAGRAFSAGADLRDLAVTDRTPDGAPDVRKALVERYHPIITTIRRMNKPVVAAVNGGAIGIGLSLALACDLVIAAQSAYFLLGFVNVGLVPDGGASLFVSARVGAARATEMALMGERVTAPEALAWGLINRVVPDDALSTEADVLGRRLAAGPTRSYAGSKRELNAALYGRLEEQLALEAETQQAMAATRDFAEGVAAFAQKRPPIFEGR